MPNIVPQYPALLYQRYLIREVSLAVLLVLAALLSLYSFFDLLGELRNLGRGTFYLPQITMYVALRMPGRAYELMPIAVLIGSLYALTTLARHSEIDVLRTSGLPTGTLLTTLLKIASVFALFTLFCGELLAPSAERAAQHLYISSTQRLIGQEFRSGVWLKDGATFINVRSVTPDSRLLGVRIYHFTADNRELAAVSEAARGKHLGDGRWQLEDVTHTRLSEKRATIERQAQSTWESNVTPNILDVLVVPPDRMSIYQLHAYTRHLAGNKQKTSRYRIALWKKIVYPLSTLVMIALALPFGYTHTRSSSVSLKIFLGVMTGIFFYMLNGLFSSLGTIHAWSPWLSAFIPSLLFFLVAMTMLRWVERR